MEIRWLGWSGVCPLAGHRWIPRLEEGDFIDSLVFRFNSDLGYDGLLVRRLKLRPTDWKSVVQVFLNPDFDWREARGRVFKR